MPSGQSPPTDDGADDTSRWQRLTGSLSNRFLKSAVAAETGGRDELDQAQPTTVPELEEAVRRCDDKERVVGLIAAPIAAAIAFVVTSSLVHNDPAALLSNGAVNPHHTNPTLYTELGLLTVVMALVMLGGAWFRKRLVIGIASALYGLSFFNLHYWGFGVPYIMIGSWYMVRAYRLSQKLKLARAEDSPAGGPNRSASRASKRYTPPAGTTVPTPKPKRKKELGAG